MPYGVSWSLFQALSVPCPYGRPGGLHGQLLCISSTALSYFTDQNTPHMFLLKRNAKVKICKCRDQMDLKHTMWKYEPSQVYYW